MHDQHSVLGLMIILGESCQETLEDNKDGCGYDEDSEGLRPGEITKQFVTYGSHEGIRGHHARQLNKTIVVAGVRPGDVA